MTVLFSGMNFANPSFANELDACPLGQVRPVKERVIEPESFTDVYSDRVVVFESNEVLSIPGEWDWIDKPKDYVRPEYIEVEGIVVTSYGWAKSEVEITFQHESHDIVKKLDGTTKHKVVPAIKKTEQRQFQEHPVVYYMQKSKRPYDPDKMETSTKIRVQAKPYLTIQRDVAYVPKYVTDRVNYIHKSIPPVTKTLIEPDVVGRIRHPATIEEYYGDCEKVEP